MITLRRLSFLVFTLLISFKSIAQTPIYTWIDGSSSSNKASSTVKTYPGPREMSASWQDANGDLYIFSGQGNSVSNTVGILDDFWKLDAAQNIWSLLEGSTGVNILHEEDRALRFDGNDDYIQFDSLRSFKNGFTWSISFKVDDLASFTRYPDLLKFTYGDSCCYSGIDVLDIGLRVFPGQNTNYIGFEARSGNNYAGGNQLFDIVEGRWYQLALTYEVNEKGLEDLFKLYINGEFKQSAYLDIDDGFDVTDTSFYALKAGVRFDGYLDKLSIWDKPLKAEEVLALSATTLTGTEEGLLANFGFNQGFPSGENNFTPPPVEFDTVYFQSDPNLGPEDPRNLVKITNSVHLAQFDQYQIFYNALKDDMPAIEPEYPSGTLWAGGLSDELNLSDYDVYGNLFGNFNQLPLNEDISLYIPTSQRFFDVKFTKDDFPDGGWAMQYIEKTKPTPYLQISDNTGNGNNGKLVNFENRATFIGSMDGVRIWNSSRTAMEIDSNKGVQELSDPNIIANYSFESGIANGDNSSIQALADDSGNGYSGQFFDFLLQGDTSNFTAATIPGFAVNNTALQFDGFSDYIEIDSLSDHYYTDFTWELWAKTTEDGTLISYSLPGLKEEWREGVLSLYLRGGFLVFEIGSVGVLGSSTGGLNDDLWHHYAVTVDVDSNGNNELVSLYIDGIPEGTADYFDFDQKVLVGGKDIFITKLGHTSLNFPYLEFTSGGLTAESQSNWVEGNNFNILLGRREALALTDKNNDFWLFGGHAFGDGLSSELAKFNKELQKWEIVKASPIEQLTPNYGITGVPSESNIPGVRSGAAGWVGEDNCLWIFGGFGHFTVDSTANFNELWKFDPLSRHWTFVGGTKNSNDGGNYGPLNQASTAFIPGARKGAATWVDQEGKFWLFGGEINGQVYNDLWMLDPINIEWILMGGDSVRDKPGSYGQLHLAQESNAPGARFGASTWIDESGSLWLFGGQGYDKNGTSYEVLNDFWKYDTSSHFWTWMGGNDFSGNTGNYGEMGIADSTNIPGARRYGQAFLNSVGTELILFGGYKFTQGKTGNYNDLWIYSIASNEWTWVDGINQTAGIEQGSTALVSGSGSKQSPAARSGASTWVDSKGRIWLGSGASSNGSQGYFNDIWRYDPQFQLWTFQGGSIIPDSTSGNYGTKAIPSEINQPEGRWHSASWTSDDDKLWFFGGIKVKKNGSPGEIEWSNDLWFYDIESELYTWVGGSKQNGAQGKYGQKGVPSINNLPGARSSAVYWTDEAGDFWLFGGYESFEYYNDLWKFNSKSLEWTWVSGRNSQNIPGNYGVKGVASSTNEIGSRRYCSSWVDKEGNFWIFGGNGRDSKSVNGFLNDLWKYDPKSQLWTWVSGSDEANDAGNYGELNVPAVDNVPPPRYGYSHWTDKYGNFYLFGGYGYDKQNDIIMVYNDLWKFNPKTELWSWIGGTKDLDQAFGYELSVYGEIGQASLSNVLGGRQRGMSFTVGEDGLFYFFGGRDFGNHYNDLWSMDFIPTKPYLYPVEHIGQQSARIKYEEAWATGFEIKVSTDSTFSDNVTTVNTSLDQFSFSALAVGTQYFSEIRAYNSFGSSLPNTFDSFITLPQTPLIKTIPVSNIGSSSIFLEWDSVNSILDYFILEVSTDSTFLDETASHPGYSSKPFTRDLSEDTIEALNPATKYFVRMRTQNETGYSPYTDVLGLTTKPAAPTIPNEYQSGTTNASLTFEWTSGLGLIEDYLVQLSSDSLFTDVLIESYVQQDVHHMSYSQLLPATKYYVRLAARNVSGQSSWSETAVVLTLPNPPVFTSPGFLHEIGQDYAVLSWENSAADFEGFIISVSTEYTFSNENLYLENYGKAGIFKEISSDSNAATIVNLSPGSSYFARIQAYNEAGISSFSNTVEFTSIPSAGQFTLVEDHTQSGVNLNWNVPVGASSFLLSIKKGEDFSDSIYVLEDVPVAVPFYVVNDLESGTNYNARLFTGNKFGSTQQLVLPAFSDTVFKTISSPPIALSTPEISQNSATLSWPASIGATAYILDVSFNNFQTYLSNYQQKLIPENTEQVLGLSPGVAYQFRARAVNESGNSPYSQIKTFITVPATPIAREPSTIAVAGFTANWDAVTGADGYILEVSDDEFVTARTFTASLANPIRVDQLTEGKEYKYRVRAFNESGASPNSNEITVIATQTSQSLNISSLSFNENFQNTQKEVIVELLATSQQGLINAWISYKGITGEVFSDSIAMTSSGLGNFSHVFTDGDIDIMGLEFIVYCSDGITNLALENNFIYKAYSEDQSPTLPLSDFGGRADNWHLFSIPYALEDNLIETVFNEMGPYKYKAEWRLMHYDGEKYVDAGAGINKIELGKGYWFNSVKEVSVKIGNATVNKKVPFTLSLREGWNQIGNPYNTPINWTATLEQNDLTNVVDPVQVFNNQTKTYNKTNIIESFSGGFVWSEGAVDVQVRPNNANASSRLNSPEQLGAAIDQPSWEVPFNLGSGMLQYTIATIGMRPDAKYGKDPYDLLLVPRFVQYTEMFTENEEATYPFFETDIRPSQLKSSWLYRLESNQLEGMQFISWDNSAFKYAEKQLWFIDEVRGVLINMAESNQYAFNFDGSQQFSIHLTANKSDLPTPFLLSIGKPYPNPSRGNVSINMALPASSKPYEVKVKVYNIKGELMYHSNHGKYEAGLHQVMLELASLSLATGLYLVEVDVAADYAAKSVHKIFIDN